MHMCVEYRIGNSIVLSTYMQQTSNMPLAFASVTIYFIHIGRGHFIFSKHFYGRCYDRSNMLYGRNKKRMKHFGVPLARPGLKCNNNIRMDHRGMRHGANATEPVLWPAYVMDVNTNAEFTRLM
jgi:hypothetical protein